MGATCRQLLPQKILVVSPTWLGDTVIAIPTFHGLRALFPQAHIAVLARQEIADLFRAVPAISAAIPYAKRRGTARLAAIADAARALKEHAFELAVILPNSLSSALICLLAGIPARLGFAAGLRGLLLTIRAARPRPGRHQMHDYLGLLQPLGSSRCPEAPALVLPEDAPTWARGYLAARGIDAAVPLIGLNPGATYGRAKQWPPERFAELSRVLLARGSGTILIVGDAAAVPLAGIIRAINPQRIISAAGQTSVLQLAALLACCHVLVTNDTGPMHVAGAVRTPVVAIFGSTDPVATGPLGADAAVVRAAAACSPCLRRTCPAGHYACMQAVSVAEVAAAVSAQLSKGRRAPA